MDVFEVSGEGNGPIDAFFNAIKGEKMDRFSFLDYSSHAITDGSLPDWELMRIMGSYSRPTSAGSMGR